MLLDMSFCVQAIVLLSLARLRRGSTPRVIIGPHTRISSCDCCLLSFFVKPFDRAFHADMEAMAPKRTPEVLQKTPLDQYSASKHERSRSPTVARQPPEDAHERSLAPIVAHERSRSPIGGNLFMDVHSGELLTADELYDIYFKAKRITKHNKAKRITKQERAAESHSELLHPAQVPRATLARIKKLRDRGLEREADDELLEAACDAVEKEFHSEVRAARRAAQDRHRKRT